MTIYLVQTAALSANRPRGVWHAVTCPDAPTVSLCLIEAWADDFADDEWEAATSPMAIRPEQLGATVPVMAVTAFGSWGVRTTDTTRQALAKIKRQWPAIAGVLAPRR